jgi:hypothetical protein
MERFQAVAVTTASTEGKSSECRCHMSVLRRSSGGRYMCPFREQQLVPRRSSLRFHQVLIKFALDTLVSSPCFERLSGSQKKSQRWLLLANALALNAQTSINAVTMATAQDSRKPTHELMMCLMNKNTTHVPRQIGPTHAICDSFSFSFEKCRFQYNFP